MRPPPRSIRISPSVGSGNPSVTLHHLHRAIIGHDVGMQFGPRSHIGPDRQQPVIWPAVIVDHHEGRPLCAPAWLAMAYGSCTSTFGQRGAAGSEEQDSHRAEKGASWSP